MQLKPQNNQIKTPNNAQLVIHAHPTQVQCIYQFSQKYQHYLSKFRVFLTELKVRRRKRDTNQIISLKVNDLLQLKQVQNTINCHGYVIIDTYSQRRNSYKGYVKYLMLGTQGHIFLLNCEQMHDSIMNLMDLLSNPLIIKFCHNIDVKFNDLKRDWGIFTVNLFDLSCVQQQEIRYVKFIRESYLNISYHSSSELILNQNPLLCAIKEQGLRSLKTLDNIEKFLNKEDPQNYYYSYYNNYQRLLAPYRHLIPSQQLLLQHIGCQQLQDKQLLRKILEWRQHESRMMDIHPQQQLPFSLMIQIIKLKDLKSIQQIQRLSDEFIKQKKYCKTNIWKKQQQFMQYYIDMQNHYDRGKIQIYDQILQIIRLHNKQKILQQFSIFQSKNNNLQKKLKQIENNKNHLWLQQKNDASIILYKQILSTHQIQAKRFQKSMKNISNQNRQQLQCYINYGKFFKQKNKKALQNQFQQFKDQLRPKIFSQDQISSNDNLEIKAQFSSPSESTGTSFRSFGSQGQLRCGTEHQNSIEHYLINQQLKQIQSIPSSIQDIYRFAAKTAQKGIKNKIPIRQKQKNYQPFFPSDNQMMQAINYQPK